MMWLLKWLLREAEITCINQHAQGMVEMSGDLGKLVAVKMDYSFFPMLGNLGGQLVTKKGDIWCSEDVLCCIDDDPLSLMLVEDNP
jgi:hypothetical protein